MSKSPRLSPPLLDNYEFVSFLGGGGFADVFLYTDHTLHRQTAIKVLHRDVTAPRALAQFGEEATVMAKVSQHPHIVSIYSTGIAADGRPFIVMEYCKAPNYQVRLRRSRLSVQECLSVGVKIAGAVEYAHRAGIVHRDIKPENILVNDFGPALTDFGISALKVGTTFKGLGIEAGDEESEHALSLPWSPPEALWERPALDERSDVYSLAATIYTLLAGASPFVLPGTGMTRTLLEERIRTEPLPQVKRSDVPQELYLALRTAMDKDARRRYSSALSFARALNTVELGMHLPETPLPLPQESLLRDEGPNREVDDADGTQLRQVITLGGQPPSVEGYSGPTPSGTQAPSAPSQLGSGMPGPMSPGTDPHGGYNSGPFGGSGPVTGDLAAHQASGPQFGNPLPPGQPGLVNFVHDQVQPQQGVLEPEPGASRKRRSRRVWPVVIASVLVLGVTAWVVYAYVWQPGMGPTPTRSSETIATVEAAPPPRFADTPTARFADQTVEDPRCELLIDFVVENREASDVIEYQLDGGDPVTWPANQNPVKINVETSGLPSVSLRVVRASKGTASESVTVRPNESCVVEK
ncbi:serine/threonine protein kinase [Micrococcales bacterium 31B]|nr:serine/threonine protein kinase [Micrococcales bacterium 31B]